MLRHPRPQFLLFWFLCLVALLAALPTHGAAPASAHLAFLPTINRPSAAPVPPPAGDWLGLVNYYRAIARLPAVAEHAEWSDGARKHARYIVNTGHFGHAEDPSLPEYTPEGDLAGQNGNVMAHSWAGYTDEQAIGLWMEGPFHAIGILDPALLLAGFGSYRDSSATPWAMAATLDVLRGRGDIPASVSFPVMWPGAGMAMPIVAYTGSEAPDPLESCPGYSAPSGPPIMLMLAPAPTPPQVTSHAFLHGATPLEHCVFDQNTYVNGNPDLQSLGRAVLGMRNAIVVMPRQPLIAGNTYTVSISVDGTTHTWSFTAQ